MLRRRILASAMASVMAIGSVAVVASADDVATASATKNVKTKADLEAYLKELDSFRNNELNDYGSISSEEMQAAFDYADNVLDNADSTTDDYTAAYAMVVAVKNKLSLYSAEQLKTLIDSCKKIYESNNIYNEELGDLIYTADSYDKFYDAYDEAESVLDSSDSRLITDSYEALDSAKKGLTALGTVTKAQFRSALKEYEAALKKEFAYDSWRIGTIDTGWAYWGYQGQTVAWGTLYEHAASVNADVKDAYKELDEIKALNKTSQVDLVDAYNACKAATVILNGFTPDEAERASKATVQKLLDKYHGRMVFLYNTTSAINLYKAVCDVVGKDNITVKQPINDYSFDMVSAPADDDDAFCIDGAKYKVDPNGGTWSLNDVYKLISAEISVKTNSKTGTTYYIPLDDSGKYWNGQAITTTKPDGKSKLVSKGATVDLTELIEVTSAMVAAVDCGDNHYFNNVNDGDAGFVLSVATTWDDVPGWYKDAHEAGQDWATLPYAYRVENSIGQWGAIAKGNCGLSGDAKISASQNLVGAYTPTTGTDMLMTHSNLIDALALAEVYMSGNKDAISDSAIYDIDTTDSIKDKSAKGSSAEWALVYRYLKYAMNDLFDASYGTHTKAEVVELIDKCYELADITGDAALFSVTHNRLVEARQYAQDWVKAANKIKDYKDNVTAVEIGGAPEVATQVYENLEKAYNNLNKDYEAFKYSFGEIYDKIAEVSDMIDSGDLKAEPALTKALEDTAYALSTVKSIDKNADGDAIELENDAFTSDREFLSYNRVYTLGDSEYDSIEIVSGTNTTEKIKMPKSSANAESATHAALTTAYEALVAAVKAQTEVKYAVGDVNHDGKVDITDASLVLKYAFNVLPEGTEFDVSLADYDTVGGKGDIADASAILKAFFKV